MRKTLVERANRYLESILSIEDRIPEGWKSVETSMDAVMEHIWAGAQDRRIEKFTISPPELDVFKKDSHDFAVVGIEGHHIVHIHKKGEGKYLIAYDPKNSDAVDYLKNVVAYVGGKSDIKIDQR